MRLIQGEIASQSLATTYFFTRAEQLRFGIGFITSKKRTPNIKKGEASRIRHWDASPFYPLDDQALKCLNCGR